MAGPSIFEGGEKYFAFLKTRLKPPPGGFKPSNRSADVEGLYLAGGAAHPGPGMPMILMSGWRGWAGIVSNYILRACHRGDELVSSVLGRLALTEAYRSSVALRQ